jgi:hypothetical protein
LEAIPSHVVIESVSVLTRLPAPRAVDTALACRARCITFEVLVP